MGRLVSLLSLSLPSRQFVDLSLFRLSLDAIGLPVSSSSPLASLEAMSGPVSLLSLSLRSKQLVDQSLLLRLSLRSRQWVDKYLFLASRLARGNEWTSLSS